MLYKKKSGFSFVELVVSVCVLAILSSISFISFSSYMCSSRDSQRVTDITALSMSLRSHTQRFGLLPQPSKNFAIKNGVLTVSLQGILDENTGIFGLANTPLDPQMNRGYGYSISASRKEYQVGATLEGSRTPSAKVLGNYRVVAKNILPSLFLAATTEQDISQTANQAKFVLDGSKSSLLYSFTDGLPVYDSSKTISTLLSDTNSAIQTSSIYSSCSEIGADNKAVGTGSYLIIDSTGSLVSTGCCLSGSSLVSC